jgi:hypothetical protein
VGLSYGRHERQAADFEELGRREEHHLRREPEDRIHQHALLEHLVVQPAAFRGDGGGQAGRPGPNDDQIANRHSIHCKLQT